MFNKLLLVGLSYLLFSLQSEGQNCDIEITGSVLDKGTNIPLSNVNVIIQELGKGASTDSSGAFFFKDLCSGEFHLILSHIGCEPSKIHLDLESDTTLNLVLAHTHIPLESVVIEGQSNTITNQPGFTVNKQAIDDQLNENLSGLLENETGVYLLKNGSGISKPVIHGLYGNRVTIMNNGVVQSGQQWGNDHSPEIDPFSANRIVVIKGTNALEYAGGNMGSIILVEPEKIKREPHLHGQLNYAYETNGRGNNLNLQLQKYSKALAWKVSGTSKKYGDRKSPNYFLRNTGLEELNFTAQLEKSWKDKLFIDFLASTFNTQLGVLRGSHIGNLTDLESSLGRDVPFYTEEKFSYKLDAPKQKVSHHLVKLSTNYLISEEKSIKLILAGQLNRRDEFDVRRNDRSDIPALSLEQFTFSTDFSYQTRILKDWKVKLGAQTIFTDNVNDPETGILPLIPDYVSFKSGLFTTLKRKWGKSAIDLGFRFDNEFQDVATISSTLPREIVRYENSFQNFSGQVGYQLDLKENHTLSINSGLTMRNPAINELYSQGLHQGVSGIEEGDIDLKGETGLKTTLEYEARTSPNFSFTGLTYYHRINDYIYLNPQDEFRLTIRGAFPVFKYEQTDAEIYGLDLSTRFFVSKSWGGEIKYSYIKGNDIGESQPLIFMPPPTLGGKMIYRNADHFDLFKTEVEGLEIELNHRYVFEQTNFLIEQDFVPPPEAYYLMGLKLSANFILPKYKIRWYAQINNLLNTEYRDYLNRQRYFADELGTSLTFGLNFKF